MILTTEQTQFLCKPASYYECQLIKRRFAYEFFGNNIFPLGSIVSFSAPVKIGPLILESALVFACELPNIDSFGGVCFYRLFNAQLGTILSDLIQKDCFVNDDSLFVEDKQLTINITNTIKSSVLGHIIVPLNYHQEELFVLTLSEEDVLAFQEKVIANFKQLLYNIFIETQRDNF